MTITLARPIMLAALLLLPQLSAAEVFMCTDPVTGKKTFTDKACPSTGQRKKVRVEPTNFGDGSKTNYKQGTWNSDRDHSVAGRNNLNSNSQRINSARSVASNN